MDPVVWQVASHGGWNPLRETFNKREALLGAMLKALALQRENVDLSIENSYFV